MPHGGALSLQPDRPAAASRQRVVKWSSFHDLTRDYLSNSPSPEGFAAILEAVDNGDVWQLMQLSEEMESKDAHLHGVMQTRRNSITALDWHIDPAVWPDDQELADDVAAFVQESLENLNTFPTTLEHLSTSIGPGVSAFEMVWERSEIVETIDVPGHRLTQEPSIGPHLRVMTDENVWPGEEMPPGKFLVFTPRYNAGFPFRITLTRAASWLYLLKHFAIADWAAFCEIFGIPFRSVTIPDGTSPGDIANVQEMTRDMAADSWGVFPEGTELNFTAASPSGSCHRDLVDWIEKKQSILFLGQTLTTDHGAVGSLALGRVHDNVRTDLLLGDLSKEARALKSGMIGPMVRMKFPNRDVPIPNFVREVHEEKNVDAARLVLDQITKAQELGLPIDPEWLHESLEIPKPKETTADVQGAEPEKVEDES